MTHPTLPLNSTHALALARIADLRAQAEHDRLVRAVPRRSRRRRPAWPDGLVAALRESLGATAGRTTRSGDEDLCVAC